MDNKFDELAKGLAQSVTRRQAFQKFGVGIAGMVLACFGLANRAEAKQGECIPPGGYGCGGRKHVPCCLGLTCFEGFCVS